MNPISTPQIRRAIAADLPAIVHLLAQDPLGQSREDPSDPLPEAYAQAFQAIQADPNQFLAVMELSGQLVGTLQLSYIPGLSRLGSWRAQIEAVRIHADFRSQGLGEQLFAWAIAQAKARGCALVQLTTDKTRPEAHRFYQKLGFEASHEGYKLKL